MKKSHRKPILKVADLSVNWEDECILNDISFDVLPGERVCLFGRSGVGKSTLFHAIAGLRKPSVGKICLAEREGEKSMPTYRDITGNAGSISYMFQTDLLFNQKTVLQNCALPLILAGISRKDAEKRVGETLSTFGLAEVAESYPSELSGGMRQRAALLRTSFMGNKVVLMDEPFSALDAFTKEELQHFFLTKAQELDLTILFISHDLMEAQAFGTRALVLAGNPQAGAPSKLIGDTDPANLASYLQYLKEPGVADK